MAPKKASTVATTASPPVPLMSARQRFLYTLGMVFSLVLFVVGGLGLLILLGMFRNLTFIVANFAMP